MADDKGDEGELQGNSEFLPFQKADNDDAPFTKDTVEVVALDAEPTVEEAQPTIAETLTATARAAYATASSLVDAVANDTPPPPIDLDETPPPSPVATTSPRKKPAPIMVKELAAAAASVGVTSPEAFRSGGPVANSPPASPKAWQAPPKADSPEARHRTMWKPRSPSVEKPAAPSPEAFRPGGRVRNSPPPSPVPHAGGLGDVFPPRKKTSSFEPDDAYDRPGPVPLSNYAAGPRLGPARLPVAVRQAGVAVRLPPVERVVQGAPDVAGRRFGETELDPVPLEHQLAPRGVHGAAQVGDGESPRLPGPRVREGKAPVADVVRRFGGGRALDGHVERHELVRLVPGIRFELLHCGRGRGRRPGSWRSRRWWRGSRRSRRRRRGSGCRRWRGAKTRRVTLAQRRGVGRAGQLRQRREVRGHGLRLLVSDLLLEGRHRKNSFSSNGTGRLLPPMLSRGIALA